jgi:hypothetical protein
MSVRVRCRPLRGLQSFMESVSWGSARKASLTPGFMLPPASRAGMDLKCWPNPIPSFNLRYRRNLRISYCLSCLTGSTQTTKLNFSPRYSPVISQQPGVGTYTPDSMVPGPALGPGPGRMCVIGIRRRGGASPSRRLPVSVKFGRGSFRQ